MNGKITITRVSSLPSVLCCSAVQLLFPVHSLHNLTSNFPRLPLTGGPAGLALLHGIPNNQRGRGAATSNTSVSNTSNTSVSTAQDHKEFTVLALFVQ